MNTYSTINKQNSITMSNPLRQTKHMVLPRVTNSALILLYVYQYSGNFTKKDLVGKALGCYDKKFTNWDWSPSAFCNEFATFNTNLLLEYREDTRFWRWGNRLDEYLEHHFGNFAPIDLTGYPYTDAIKYNEFQKQKQDEAYEAYKIGQDIFFQ